MSNSSIDEAKHRVEDKLAPYGYDILRKDKPDELLIGFAELGFAALALLTWSAFKYLEAFLKELGKQHAQILTSENVDQLDQNNLEEKLDEILEKIRDLRRQYDEQDLEQQIIIQEELLKEQFILIGLSRFRAAKAARDIRPILEQELLLLIEQNNEIT